MFVLYLDTSAFIKRFKREAGSKAVRGLFRIVEESPGRMVLATSDWTINESLSAIRRWRLTEFELRNDAGALLAEVGRCTVLNILRFVPMTPDLCEESRELIVDYRLSAGDALQLHSARVTHCDAFLSADEKLLTVSRDAGLTAINVRKPAELHNLRIRLGN